MTTKKKKHATAQLNAITARGTENDIWNVPNIITMVRLVLAIAVFVLIPLHQFTAALIVFVIAASTDWMDGYWARKYGQVTKLGRVLDPFVDKIIICGTYIFLAAEVNSGIAAWMATVVMGRELLVTALRSVIEGSGGDFSAKWAGKVKMVVQCLAVVASLVALRHFAQYGAGTPLPDWLGVVLPIAVWGSIAITIYSGLEYVFIAAKKMN
ncbi:CDP-diacylglycerol--glycerol-3-phosphate 3-phosphatidyltransferase [Anatilimnocola aggregata]|uniref:CDP-diacylglycerol--glycerol-3-phosphate 3-phosphatidyltransferase n=1 Tax=Anatilimnocola aggregata TaxID=2528021 RepID=A0A517Y5H6_9BACT|nr:CDP-diacylglycerol--glycerol-3-phosphate 3-phosphatidyltransferase [Anatilimnocola aggregata]QDU25485.1 CDP-diacylglycerol--glycerol-3-phosphate 3-phosphatidyltransferase [Anatilimnocola aggregata]